MITIKTMGLHNHFNNEYNIDSNQKIGDFIINLIQQEKIDEYISLELKKAILFASSFLIKFLRFLMNKLLSILLYFI